MRPNLWEGLRRKYEEMICGVPRVSVRDAASFFQSGDEDVNKGAFGAALHRPVHCSTVTRSKGLNPGREGRLATPE